MKTRIALQSATPGLRLSDAIVDDAGRVLVPDGAILTDALLHSLQRRGVVELAVDLVDDEDPAVLEARRISVERAVAVHFRQAGEGIGTRALREAIRAFRLERGE